MHEICAAGEDVWLQRNPKAAAVIDHIDMVMRDAAGPGVEIKPFVELAGLRRLGHLLENIAAAQRKAAPAGAPLRLQNHAIVASAIEFIGRAQAGYAGTK